MLRRSRSPTVTQDVLMLFGTVRCHPVYVRDHVAPLYLLGSRYELTRQRTSLRLVLTVACATAGCEHHQEYLRCLTSDRLVTISFDSILYGDSTGIKGPPDAVPVATLG